MERFMVLALAASVGVAAVTAPLGCFVVWRRMAFFGDTLAHAALLGVVLGIAAGLGITLGTLLVCAALGIALVGLERRGGISVDTLLGIFSHSALALGIVALAFVDPSAVRLEALLFGDVLAITPGDLATIYVGGALVLAGLRVLWAPLLALTAHEELARVEGIPTARIHLGYVVLLAAVVAVAMKIVGVLLVTAFLVIPPAIARRFVASPEQMAGVAAGAGVAAAALGLWASYQFDAPAGPAMVVAAFVLFAVAQLVPGRAAARGGPSV